MSESPSRPVRQSPHPHRRQRRPARPRARKNLCRLSAPSSLSIANPSISPMPSKPASWFAAPRPTSFSTPPPTPPSTAPRRERDLAYAINAQAPRVLAEEALRRNALFVHYSTDYVFDGGKSSPWVETDTPNPLNVYGASKLAGEQAVEGVGGKLPHLPHQLGLRPARQQFSAHHASPGARARPSLDRRRPNRRAHDFY